MPIEPTWRVIAAIKEYGRKKNCKTEEIIEDDQNRSKAQKLNNELPVMKIKPV